MLTSRTCRSSARLEAKQSPRMHRTQPVWIGTTQTSSQACEAVLAPSFEAPGMAAPAALGQLEGFLGNLNLGKYFEVMRDNEVRRHHPRQRRPVPASPWALPGADLHRDGRR